MADVVSTAIYRAALDNQAYIQAAAAQDAANQKLVDSTTKVVVAEEKITAATRTTADGFTKLEARYDPLIKAEQRYQAAIAQATRYYEEGAVGQERYAAHITRVEADYAAQVAAAGRLVAANRNLAASTEATGAGFGRFRGSIQNASYQFADFAVQLGTGTNVMRAVAQQGSQLLAGFGLWGAVIGAAVAVVGTLAEKLLGSGSAADTAKAAEDAYRDAVDKTNAILQTSVERQNADTAAKLKAAEASTLNAIALERENQSRLQSRATAIPQAAEDLLRLQGRTEEQIAAAPLPGGLAEALGDTGRQLAASSRRMEELAKALEQIRAGVSTPTISGGTAGSGGAVMTPGQQGDAVTAAKKALDTAFASGLGQNRASQLAISSDPMAKQRLAELQVFTAEVQKQIQVLRDAGQGSVADAYTKDLEGVAKGQVAADAATKAHNEAIAAQKKAEAEATAAGKKAASEAEASAKRHAEAMKSLVGQLDPLGKATEEQAQKEKLLDDAEKAHLITAEQHRQLLETLHKGYADILGPYQTYVDKVAEETRLAGMGNDQRQVEVELRGFVNDAIAKGTPLTDAQTEALRQQLEVTQQVGKATEDAATAAKKAEEDHKRFLESVGNEMSGFFDQTFDRVGQAITEAFTQGKAAAVDFLSIAQGVLSELLQEILKLAAINPLKNLFNLNGGARLPEIGDVAGFLGSGVNAPGTSSGGGFLSGIGNLFSGGMGSTNKLLDSIFGGTFFGGAPSNAMSASVVTGAGRSLGNIAGGTSGFLGGFGGSAALGIGSALLSIAMGGDVGSSLLSGGLGLAGSLIGGPVGGVLGSLVGNLLGGLLGGGQKNLGHGEQNFTFGPGGFTAGSTKVQGSGGQFLQQVSQDAATVGSSVGQILSQISGTFIRNILGEIKQTDGGKGFGYSVTDPLTGLQVRERQAGATGDEQLAIQRATFYTLQVAARGGALKADPVYQNIFSRSGDLEEAQKLIGIAQKVFTELKPQPVGQFKTALDDLKAAFDAARESAAKLGVTQAELTKRYFGQLGALQKDFDANFRALRGDSTAQGVKSIEDQIKAMISDVQALFPIKQWRDVRLGMVGDYANTLVDQLFAQSPAGQIKGFLTGLDTSNLSPYGLEEQYTRARSTFLDTRTAALGGDPSAVGRYQSDASLFLNLSRQFNASGASYAPDYALVQSAGDEIVSVAEQQLDVTRDMLAQLIAIAKNTAAGQQSAVASTGVKAPTPTTSTKPAANAARVTRLGQASPAAGVPRPQQPFAGGSNR